MVSASAVICMSQVQDARVAMRLYQLHKKEWEKTLNRHHVSNR